VRRSRFREKRNARASTAYRRFIFHAEHEDPHISEVLEFWEAHGGNEIAFRLRDWTNYLSCRLGAPPTALDQPLQQIDSTHFQLVRVARYGTRTSQPRLIVKPELSTIVIANEESDLVEADDNWSLDEETGILTKLGGFSGTPTSWGGQYYCNVRFNTDPDLAVTFESVQSMDIEMIEIPLDP
jgi:uncharacterized protein (TIGR02217 family)